MFRLTFWNVKHIIYIYCFSLILFQVIIEDVFKK